MNEQESGALVARYHEVRERIEGAVRKAGRDAGSVSLVAVSKTHPAESVEVVAGEGQVVFGESYVQEALAKQEELSRLPLEWHFIGHLQSKKARDVVGRFALIHGVDNLKLAQNLQNRMAMLPVTTTGADVSVQDILIQVNIGREPQKGGIAIEDLLPFAEDVVKLPQLRLRGLMCMPPFHCVGDLASPFFAHLRELKEQVERHVGMTLPHLSMGMSQDFEQAIAEGATLVRVGTDIFGERPA
ncbi:YggS family pyridoxal phosphate-dependent enzyme [Desulfovibrio mangrovi]|nr:YggS family pyridoxal phosphate-dependent enzyme [Desulfovibrio mangrovi]UZP69162.1 YggS family pyridoxal phosphate-dependent enzyme [Desulfovibrio mangrovi]